MYYPSQRCSIFRNGFSNVGVSESAGYGGLAHAHLPSQPQQQQQETVQSQPQPSPRPTSQPVAQENQPQSNGGNVPNQQPLKQTAPTSTTTTTATEGQRPEGSE